MIAYFEAIAPLLNNIMEQESGAIKKAAMQVSQRLQEGGIIQLFGCGHSHLLALEPYYRAGGLVPVKAIVNEKIMLHNGGINASSAERDPDFFQRDMQSHFDIDSRDTVIVISTSGRNPVPMDAAIEARKAGAYTIALSSLAYKSLPSRHPSEKKLVDVTDDLLNTHVPVGDGILSADGLPEFGPSSSIAAGLMLHALLSEVILDLIEKGIDPPVFKSGNIDGNNEHNKRLIERYKHRIHF